MASSGGASSTPQNGMTMPSTIGTRIEAQIGTRVVFFISQGCSTSCSITTMMAYMPSRKASRSRSRPWTRMQKVGPISAMTPPMFGTKAISPATSAHAGASGTRRISKPISHSTATHNASIDMARHQFTSAVPAVRRCCAGLGRPLRVGPAISTGGLCGFAYPTGCSGRWIAGGSAGSCGTGAIDSSSDWGSSIGTHVLLPLAAGASRSGGRAAVL